MPRASMTPKERRLAVLAHQTPDRLPMDYWATPEATSSLIRHLGVATEREMFDRLHIDYLVNVGRGMRGRLGARHRYLRCATQGCRLWLWPLQRVVQPSTGSF